MCVDVRHPCSTSAGHYCWLQSVGLSERLHSTPSAAKASTNNTHRLWDVLCLADLHARVRQAGELSATPGAVALVSPLPHAVPAVLDVHAGGRPLLLVVLLLEGTVCALSWIVCVEVVEGGVGVTGGAHCR